MTHFRIWEKPQLSRLIQSALLVLARREMSLNRRLFSWLLGGNEENTEYFPKYAKEVTAIAVKELFLVVPDSVPSATLPPKILMALLDKVQVGSFIIDDVLISVLRFLSRCQNSTFSHEVRIVSQSNLHSDLQISESLV